MTTPSAAETPKPDLKTCPKCGAAAIRIHAPLVHLGAWECGSRYYASPRDFGQSTTCRIAELQADLSRVTAERDEAVGLLRTHGNPFDSYEAWDARREALLSRLDQPQEKRDA